MLLATKCHKSGTGTGIIIGGAAVAAPPTNVIGGAAVAAPPTNVATRVFEVGEHDYDTRKSLPYHLSGLR